MIKKNPVLPQFNRVDPSALSEDVGAGILKSALLAGLDGARRLQLYDAATGGGTSILDLAVPSGDSLFLDLTDLGGIKFSTGMYSHSALDGFLGGNLVFNPGFETAGAAVELLTNGGFETAGAGGADVFGSWTEWVDGAGGAISDEVVEVHGGGHAAKMTYNATIRQSIVTTPGATYQLTYWTRGDGTNQGQHYVYDVTNAAAIIPYTGTGVTGTTYTRVSKAFTAPAGCVEVRITLASPSGAASIAYFDDVSVMSADLFGSWTETVDVGAIADETTTVHGGAHSAKMVGGVGKWTTVMYSSNFVTVPGATYQLSAWVYGDGSPAPSYFRVDDMSGGGGSGIQIIPVTTTGADTADWYNTRAKFVAPSALTRLFFQMAPGRTSYFDDVEVIKLSGNPNLILNPGFETAGAGGADLFANWTESAGSGAIADETTLVHGGSHALKLTTGATVNTLVVQQKTGLTSGATCQLTFWTRGDGTYAGRFSIHDPDNVAYVVQDRTTGVTGTTYTMVSYSFVVPAGCTRINFYLHCPATNTGIAYFDDVEVVAIDSPISIWKG